MPVAKYTCDYCTYAFFLTEASSLIYLPTGERTFNADIISRRKHDAGYTHKKNKEKYYLTLQG